MKVGKGGHAQMNYCVLNCFNVHHKYENDMVSFVHTEHNGNI
jgi:hypothetical protein